jgi:hypothetical protein
MFRLADTQVIEAVMEVVGDMLSSFSFAQPGVEKSELNIRVMG